MSYINSFSEDAFKQMAKFFESNWKFVFKKDMVKKEVSSGLSKVLQDTRFKLETLKYRLSFEVMGYLSDLSEKRDGLSSVSDDMLASYFNTGSDLSDLIARYSLAYSPEKYPDGAVTVELHDWADEDIALVCALSKEFPCFELTRVEEDDPKLLCRYNDFSREEVPASKLSVFDLCKELKDTYKKLVTDVWMNFISSLMFYRAEKNPESLESMCHLWAYDNYGYIDMFVSLISNYLIGADNLIGVDNSSTIQMKSMEQVQYFKELVECYDDFEVSSVARPDGYFDVTLYTSPFTEEKSDEAVTEAAKLVKLPDALVQRMLS